MKKAWTVRSFILIAVLSLLLSGCNSNSVEPESFQDTNEPAALQPERDASDKNSNPYIQGTFTESLYYSEWLNLRFEISSDFEASPATIQAYNKSQNREIVEMQIQNENQSMSIFVTKNISNKSLNQFAEAFKENVEDADQSTTSKMQNYTIRRAWESTTYNLVGTEYLLLSSESQNYLDGKPYKKMTSWNLFREKDDYYVQIQCVANNRTAIEKLLAGFTSYADITDISSGMKEKDAESTETVVSKTTAFNNKSSASNDKEPANTDPCEWGHSWVAETKNIHHEATGHYETVTDAKKVNKYRCPMCGYNQPLYDSLDDYYSHADSVHENTALRDSYEIVERWEYYDTQEWVVDSEAYDETVITGYQCSICGKRKTA